MSLAAMKSAGEILLSNVFTRSGFTFSAYRETESRTVLLENMVGFPSC